jgi:hypothetical protein
MKTSITPLCAVVVLRRSIAAREQIATLDVRDDVIEPMPRWSILGSVAPQLRVGARAWIAAATSRADSNAPCIHELMFVM